MQVGQPNGMDRSGDFGSFSTWEKYRPLLAWQNMCVILRCSVEWIMRTGIRIQERKKKPICEGNEKELKGCERSSLTRNSEEWGKYAPNNARKPMIFLTRDCFHHSLVLRSLLFALLLGPST